MIRLFCDRCGNEEEGLRTFQYGDPPPYTHTFTYSGLEIRPKVKRMEVCNECFNYLFNNIGGRE